MKVQIPDNLCIWGLHDWEYSSVGSFDVGEGYGLRHRKCTSCGKRQRFDAFCMEYVDGDYSTMIGWNDD